LSYQQKQRYLGKYKQVMVKLDLVHELNVLDAGDAELPASPM
jgi:hypothetical protein